MLKHFFRPIGNSMSLVRALVSHSWNSTYCNIYTSRFFFKCLVAYSPHILHLHDLPLTEGPCAYMLFFCQQRQGLSEARIVWRGWKQVANLIVVLMQEKQIEEKHVKECPNFSTNILDNGSRSKCRFKWRFFSHTKFRRQWMETSNSYCCFLMRKRPQ